MKVLVLPDIHLKPYIFFTASELMRQGVADKAVCLMDIPDDWGMEFAIDEYVKTFDAAISFAKEFPNSLWCYGNHDLSYLWEEMESGFSYMAKWTVQKKLMELSMALPSDNPIQYVQCIDNVLFCHGGIARYFVEKYVSASKYDDVSYVVDTMNSLGHREMWCDDSPIWYRPQHYKGEMYQAETYLQVVGHTPVEKIDRCKNMSFPAMFSRLIGTARRLGHRNYCCLTLRRGNIRG